MKLKINKVFSLLILSVLFFPTYVEAQIPDNIILSLKSGNAKVLSEYFNQNVELVILKDENVNVYSKAQAQQIVSKFFSEYSPNAFEVIHERGSENDKYVIGNLITKKGTFRVYFLLRQKEGKTLIHQFRIEKQE